MSTDAVHEIEKVFNDLDAHRNLHVLDKYVPRGSQEFREALTECQNDEEAVPQQRERSRTIDSTYRKPHSVHFASNLTTCGKKNRSGDDLHIHLHPDGILRHSRERSNTYDGTVQRPRKSVGISPLCYDNDSAVEKLLKKSPNARKVEETLLKEKLESASRKSSSNSKSDMLSPLRRHKSESSAHSYIKQSSPKSSPKSSPRSSPKILRKTRVDSPLSTSRKISAS